jgi:hypothetical protein
MGALERLEPINQQRLMEKNELQQIRTATYTAGDFLEDCQMIAGTLAGRLERSIPAGFDLSALAHGFAEGRARENRGFDALLRVHRRFQARYDNVEARQRFCRYVLVNQLLDNRRDDLMDAGLARRQKGNVSFDNRVLRTIFGEAKIGPRGDGFYRIVNGGAIIDRLIQRIGERDVPVTP